MRIKYILIILVMSLFIGCLAGCSLENAITGASSGTPNINDPEEDRANTENVTGDTTEKNTMYTDKNGDVAYIPEGFAVSSKEDEQTVSAGLVIIGPDGSEFVWIPTTKTELKTRDFGNYVSWGGPFEDYYDETELESYKAMVASTQRYGGFYMGRYEASFSGGDDISNYTPASKRGAEPWVRFDPADTDAVCRNLYADNDSVQGFFPWGINYDTTLQWLIDSGCKSKNEVASDSTNWGNYSNDTFSPDAGGRATGAWEEAKANNIYDLAGNNWEWTQERYGSGSYVMRGGGYDLMGGECPGSAYPAALRDPLPGSDRHPNVTFRIALYLQ